MVIFLSVKEREIECDTRKVRNANCDVLYELGAADLSLASNMISGMSSNSTTSIRPSASAESSPSGLVHSPPCFDLDDSL